MNTTAILAHLGRGVGAFFAFAGLLLLSLGIAQISTYCPGLPGVISCPFSFGWLAVFTGLALFGAGVAIALARVVPLMFGILPLATAFTIMPIGILAAETELVPFGQWGRRAVLYKYGFPLNWRFALDIPDCVYVQYPQDCVYPGEIRVVINWASFVLDVLSLTSIGCVIVSPFFLTKWREKRASI